MLLSAAAGGPTARPPACLPQKPSSSSSVRCIQRSLVTTAASKRLSPVSQGLLTVLKDELKVEKERYRTPEAVLDGPPNGFELQAQDRPNSAVLLLTRSFGEEDIFVEVDINGPDEDEDVEELDEEEASEVLPPVAFNVAITKEDRMMTFSCEADGSGIAIRNVSLTEVDSEEGEEGEEEEALQYPPYNGPVFDELDDTLQQAFADYLEERGITADFGVYLMELVHDKLEVEYMDWLRRAREFVSS